MRVFLAIAVGLVFFVDGLRAGDFTKVLWTAAEPVYARTLQHPFLLGLSDGTLPKRRFQFYLVQDAQYLRVFGQALSLLAAKAPQEQWAVTLNQHAIDTLKAERELHDSILASYGLDSRNAAAEEMAPSNVAYTNHLLAVVSQRPFIEGLAAVLPCYWIYEKVGKHLSAKGSPKPEYQQWIAMYGGESYAESVRAVLLMMDQSALRESEESRLRAIQHFSRSARYEYLFWDMAWREERWLP
ncbi:MAG: thiaminase II [Bryobacterales bacterium]|nr:thiaminase II [Bryobacterales bacterium]